MFHGLLWKQVPAPNYSWISTGNVASNFLEEENEKEEIEL